MAYSDQKVEDTVLALLGFFASQNGQTWKRYEFSVMASLHAKGLITDPRGRQESVALTPEGLALASKLADQFFSE